MAEVRAGARASPRTSKLFASGASKMAQKVIEEAAEAAIEAVRGDRIALINESVDLFYNLSALWAELGVSTDEIWSEMDRREAALGMAEKLPKSTLDEVYDGASVATLRTAFGGGAQSVTAQHATLLSEVERGSLSSDIGIYYSAAQRAEIWDRWQAGE